MNSTIYQNPSGTYSRFEGEDKTPVNAIFLHTREQGDFNAVSYLSRKAESTRSITRSQYYFIPNEGADEKAIKREIERGKEFFSKKEGFLFGALFELAKMGQIIEISC